MGDEGEIFVRRAEFDDQPHINELVGEEAHVTARRFGDYNVATMIEQASLGITAVDDKDAVVGYAAFFDFPYLKNISQQDWPSWLHSAYGNAELTPANTAWLSFFIADPLCQTEVAENILRTAFTTLPEVDALLLALPADVRPFAPLRDTFEQLPAAEHATATGGVDETDTPPPEAEYNVYVCPRGLYLPELLVREARVEDHDDLVPVFDSQSEVLSERYGEFFIAELIASQDEVNRAVVGEVDGHAVGLMGCSAEIDVSILQDCFDLEPYENLMKPDDDGVARAAAARRRAQDLAIAATKAAAAAAEAQLAVMAAQRKDSDDEAEHEDGDGDGGAPDMEGADKAAAAEKLAAAADAAAAAAEAAEAEAAEADKSIAYMCSAFCISVFCIDEAFESRSRDFLQATFALYPDKEYIVITLPHAATEFPLLNLFNQVEPKPSSSFGHLLYLFHRDALLGPLQVRMATKADEDSARALTKNLTTRMQLNEVFSRATVERDPDSADADDSGERAFMAVVAGQAVGIALLQRSVDVDLLQAQYSLEDFLLMSEHAAAQHVELLGFVINPIFARSSRYFLKEVLRQLLASCMYYRVGKNMPIPDVLSEFVQVRPRAQIAVSETLEAELRKDHGEEPDTTAARRPLTQPADKALFFLTRKLISEPKIVNNTRIVVVGTSDTALAFLEALVSVPYLNFTSLYLLAPHAGEKLLEPRGVLQLDGGAAGAADTGAATTAPFFSRSCAYSPCELAALNLGARVRLIDGKLIDIDRTRKAVVLPDESIVPYDFLVVAPELGDASVGKLLDADAAGMRGVFSLSDDDAALAARTFLQTAAGANGGEGKVLVYGAVADAYCTLEALRTRGVPPSELLLVTPPRREGGPADAFGDPKILAAVHAQMKSLGISLLQDHKLSGVEADGARLLSAVSLDGPDGHVLQRARMLLCCDVPDVDRSLFRAFNDNSIVYDGRLVVDAAFRTNDAAIYAAGQLTKFARRFRAKLPSRMCCGREAGAKLAASLLSAIDALSATDEPDKPPAFTQPTKLAATLPGGLSFFRVLPPVVNADCYDEVVKHKSFGRELVNDLTDRVDETGAPLDGWSLTTMRLDKFGRVSSLAYVGKAPVETENWGRLIGLHESALNHLAARFDEGLVTDMPAFLRQNWAMAIFHDRFAEFRAALRDEMQADDDFKQVLEQMKAAAAQSERPMSPAEFVHKLPKEKQALVRTRLTEYVQTNQNQLSMYLLESSGIMKKMEDKDLRKV